MTLLIQLLLIFFFLDETLQKKVIELLFLVDAELKEKVVNINSFTL